MEPKGSLPHSQDSATCLSVLSQNEYMPHHPTLFLTSAAEVYKRIFDFICLDISPSLPWSGYIVAVSFNAFTYLPGNCVYRSLLIFVESSLFYSSL
jgi:hypothetical protein